MCNQSCYFCPVSIAPREDYFMPTELYERIVGELAAYRDTIEAVFMINYNEPTADRRFVDQVRTIKAAGLPPAVLTNGSGLTPDRIDALVEMGGLRFLSINLSTLDRERYRRDRGGDHLPLVLRNLDHARDKPLAERMDMAVLGTGDEDHKRDFEEISQRFAGSRFDVKYYEVMDRAGYLQIGQPAGLPDAAPLRLRERRLAPLAAPPHHPAGEVRALLRGLRRQVRGGRPHPRVGRRGARRAADGPDAALGLRPREGPRGLPLLRLHLRPHPSRLIASTRPRNRCAWR